MILAAGLTPALQQILVFDSLRLGQVNRARQALMCASGKVLNVGIALHHLGGPDLTLALLGGAAGEAIGREFASLGIAHRWIWTGESTRMCTTLLDHSNGVTTELVENARPVEEKDLEQFVKAYEAVVPQARAVVLSGSLPAGTPKHFYRNLITRTQAPVILDASGAELLEALPSKPFCVKPNREELSRTLGRDLKSDSDLRGAMSEVCQLGADWIVVSHGTESLWASNGEQTYTYYPVRLTPVNPIASGDCLAAGIAWALAQGMPMTEAIQFGIAAAADNASMLMPARLDPGRVRRLKESVGWQAL